MWQLMGVKREDTAERAKALMENFRFWGAPVGIIVTVDRVWASFGARSSSGRFETCWAACSTPSNESGVIIVI